MVHSYNGWPASRDPSAIGINSKWAPLGHPFPAGCKAGDVEKIFTYFVVQLDARVEPIELYSPGDEWGYNYRVNVNNPAVLSCHASGTAFDYNATRHPNGRRGTWKAWQVDEIRKIQAEVGRVVRWGFDFLGTPDEMHFEIAASAAAVAVAARNLRPAPIPVPPPEDELKATYFRKANQTQVYLGAVGMAPRPVKLFRDMEYHFVGREGNIILDPPADSMDVIADGEGQSRKVMIMADASMFGIT